MSSNIAALSLLAAFGVAVVAATPVAGEPPAKQSLTIQMHALNNSGQDGTATLTPSGDKVIVSVHLVGEAKGASEPAHVHLGRCPNIKAVPAYNVGPVLDNEATSKVDLSWNEIASGKYVVNVHESVAMLGKYVSCGNIGDATSPLPLPTEDSGY